MIRLLLIIAFETDPIARPENSFEQSSRVTCFDKLSFGKSLPCDKSLIARNLLPPPRDYLLPFNHRPAPISSSGSPVTRPGNKQSRRMAKAINKT